jgi:hypothetical protein
MSGLSPIKNIYVKLTSILHCCTFQIVWYFRLSVYFVATRSKNSQIIWYFRLSDEIIDMYDLLGSRRAKLNLIKM